MANLHEAVHSGNIGAVTSHIQGGAAINEVRDTPFSNSCSTALHVAAEAGNLDVVQYLLAQGANADVPDLWGHTAAHLAAQEGHTDILQVRSPLTTLIRCQFALRLGTTPRILSSARWGRAA